MKLDRLCRIVAVLAGGLLLASGCGSQQQQLTLTSSRQGQAFTPAFSRAYAMRENDGESDIVLVDRAAQTAIEGRQSESPVQQVLHVRVLWHPSREMKVDHTSATNATLHWYVMSSTSPGDILEYAGTAFVAVDRDTDVTDVTVSNAHLKPVACRGALCDPIGPSTLTGKIRASNSAARVRQALSIVRTAVATAQNQPANTASSHSRPEQPSSAAR